MNRTTVIAAAAATLVTAATAINAPQAETRTVAASAEATCEETYADYRGRLARQIMPTRIKQGYESDLYAAYQRCRDDKAMPWNRIENILR